MSENPKASTNQFIFDTKPISFSVDFDKLTSAYSHYSLADQPFKPHILVCTCCHGSSFHRTLYTPTGDALTRCQRCPCDDWRPQKIDLSPAAVQACRICRRWPTQSDEVTVDILTSRHGDETPDVATRMPARHSDWSRIRVACRCPCGDYSISYSLIHPDLRFDDTWLRQRQKAKRELMAKQLRKHHPGVSGA